MRGEFRAEKTDAGTAACDWACLVKDEGQIFACPSRFFPFARYSVRTPFRLILFSPFPAPELDPTRPGHPAILTFDLCLLTFDLRGISSIGPLHCNLQTGNWKLASLRRVLRWVVR